MGRIDDLIQRTPRDEHARRELGQLASDLIARAAYEDALRVFDTLIWYRDTALSSMCNALWVIQEDNTGLPVDTARTRAYLAATLLRAGANPEMYLNAAGAFMELREGDAALRQLLLAKQHGVDLEPYLAEPLLAPLKQHPRWKEVCGAEQGPPVDPPSWMEIAGEACARGALKNAYPALRQRWEQTRSPRLADLIDRLCERVGERVGYCGACVEEALQERPEELLAVLDSGARVGRNRDGSPVSRDQDDSKLIWVVADIDDPRFSAALVRLFHSLSDLQELKVIEDGLRSLADHVVGLNDKRLVEPMVALSKEIAGLIPNQLGQALQGVFLRAAEALRDLEPPDALTQEEEAFCDTLESILGEPRGSPPFAQRLVTPGPPSIPPPGPPSPAPDDRILALWRETRSPRVAAILDLVATREAKGPDLERELRDCQIPGDDSDSDSDSDRDVGAKAAAQLIWRAKKDDDPRVTGALVRLLERDPPFIFAMRESNSVEDFWSELMSACESIADLRVVDPLIKLSRRVRALTAEADAEAEEDMYSASALGPALEHQLAQCADAVKQAAPLRELRPDESLRCEGWEADYAAEKRATEAALAARAQLQERAAALLEAVADNPDDDEPRLAYAALLEEHGDASARARGRFIRAQIEAVGSGKLHEQGACAWLGDLGAIVSDPRYERGFVAGCTLNVASTTTRSANTTSEIRSGRLCTACR